MTEQGTNQQEELVLSVSHGWVSLSRRSNDAREDEVHDGLWEESNQQAFHQETKVLRETTWPYYVRRSSEANDHLLTTTTMNMWLFITSRVMHAGKLDGYEGNLQASVKWTLFRFCPNVSWWWCERPLLHKPPAKRKSRWVLLSESLCLRAGTRLHLNPPSCVHPSSSSSAWWARSARCLLRGPPSAAVSESSASGPVFVPLMHSGKIRVFIYYLNCIYVLFCFLIWSFIMFIYIFFKLLVGLPSLLVSLLLLLFLLSLYSNITQDFKQPA